MNQSKINTILNYFDIPNEKKDKVSRFIEHFIHFKRVMDKEIGSPTSLLNTEGIREKINRCLSNKNQRNLNINKKEVKNRIKSQIGEDFYIFPLELFQRYGINSRNTELIMNRFIEKMLYFKLYSVKKFIHFYIKNILELDEFDKIDFLIKMGIPNNIRLLNEWIGEFEQNIISNQILPNRNITVCKTSIEGNKYQPNNMIKEFNTFQMVELQSSTFMLYLTDLDFPDFMNGNIQSNFENKLKFYVFIEKDNKKNCYISFSPGAFFTRDFLQNYLNPDHLSSKFFQYFVNQVIETKLKKFENIIFMGHSRGSQISQMLAYYISIHYPRLVDKIYVIGTVSTAWLFNPEDFNSRLRGHFILFGYFELDFMGLIYDETSFTKKILPVYFDQFMFYYTNNIRGRPGLKHPKLFFITKSYLSYEEKISQLQLKLSNRNIKKKLIDNLIENCKRMAFNICNYNMEYLIKIINIFYEYLSSYLNINLLYSYPRMHHSINNLIGFNLKLVRIKVCKEPIDLTHKIIYTKCYHIWYPLYYNALIDLFR